MGSEILEISILVDDPTSWIVPYARRTAEQLAQRHGCRLFFDADQIPCGDMLFLLGCTSILPAELLARNRHTFVVHESDLPKGRGWSPVSWQVLEGKNKIPIVLFEATDQLDAGPVYLKDYIELDGTELLAEIKHKQGLKTQQLVIKLVELWPDIKPVPQSGQPTYYRRRTRQDDRLDVNKTIAEQFDHLRIVHNEKYPAWFEYRGHEYVLQIHKVR